MLLIRLPVLPRLPLSAGEFGVSLLSFPWPAPLPFLHLYLVNGPNVAVQVAVLSEHLATNLA